MFTCFPWWLIRRIFRASWQWIVPRCHERQVKNLDERWDASTFDQCACARNVAQCDCWYTSEKLHNCSWNSITHSLAAANAPWTGLLSVSSCPDFRSCRQDKYHVVKFHLKNSLWTLSPVYYLHAVYLDPEKWLLSIWPRRYDIQSPLMTGPMLRMVDKKLAELHKHVRRLGNT